jgi:hypothetical protein
VNNVSKHFRFFVFFPHLLIHDQSATFNDFVTHLSPFSADSRLVIARYVMVKLLLESLE